MRDATTLCLIRVGDKIDFSGLTLVRFLLLRAPGADATGTALTVTAPHDGVGYTKT